MGYDSPPPYRDGRVHVLSERCKTCVFRPGNPVHLNPGRLKDLIESNLEVDSAFACHQTLWDKDSPQAVCRGYYDAYGQEVTPLRLAKAMGLITEQQPPERDFL